MLMRVKVDQDEKELLKASGNYIKESDCWEVEIVKRDVPYPNLYRISTGKDCMNITKSELKALKAILNNHSVSYLLELDKIGDNTISTSRTQRK